MRSFLLYLNYMFCVYVIYSEKLNRFYIGTTDNFENRLKQHNVAEFSDAYTIRGIPWAKYLLIENLGSHQYAIENHIKRMKSKKYIENMRIYPDMIQNLIQKYRS